MEERVRTRAGVQICSNTRHRKGEVTVAAGTGKGTTADGEDEDGRER
jgi:hypothetical protein